MPDFALARANGDPLYTLVNPVDDALMEITHVLRGEDLLSSTPRQVALYDALKEVGDREGARPRFGHLPYVMGEGNKKLSKRDPEAHLLAYREQGFLPEGLLNYLALLGWAIAEDRDVFTLEEMVEAFDIRRVNPNPARFDLKKAEAINAAHMRMLSIEEMAERVTPYLQQAGVLADPVTADEASLLARAMPLVHERMNKLTEAAPMLGFLFTDERRPRRGRRRQGARRRGAEGRRRGPRRARCARPTGRPRPSTRHSVPRWSTDSASSRATPSARCAWPSPGAGSRRRCSSPSSCSGRERSLARLDAAPGRRWAGMMSYPQGPPRAGNLGTLAAAAARSSPYQAHRQPYRPSSSGDPRGRAHPHPEPRSYPLMLRTWDYAWWKPVVGILMLIVGGLLVMPLLLIPVLAVVGRGRGRAGVVRRTASWSRPASSRSRRPRCSTST